MRFLLLYISFSFSLGIFAQNLDLPRLRIPNTRNCDRDPQKLVAKLTQGLSSDKDKFDAIFTWVALNIHYDYATYLSPRGATAPRLNHILRSKSAICIDYAYLMDTLCSLAGINSVSVYGYAKDDLFDVGDSLYMDNHAWNAVKLDDNWYEYDMTWSAGQYEPEFKPFSKFILRLGDRLNATKRLRTITFRVKHKSECDRRSGKFTQTYYTLPRWSYVILKMLWHVPLRFHWVLQKDLHSEFYLSNPKMFAITHIPDDPGWSLTEGYSTIRTFENDSAYYALNDSSYESQQRHGTACAGCDLYLSSDEMTKQKLMKHNSWEFNPRNHFVPWVCDYTISDLFYKQSLPLTDSASKIQQIDSALVYLATAKDDLKKCSRDINKESQLQRLKNQKKLKALTNENRVHASYMHGVLASTNKATGKMKKFISRTRVTELGLEADKKKLQKLKVKTNPYKNKDNVVLMLNKYTGEMRIVDSISAFIAAQRDTYSGMLARLSDNLWMKGQIGDSLGDIFYRGERLRKMNLLDNYKKMMVDMRRGIEPVKKLYAADLNTKVYGLSDSCADIGMAIFRAMGKRDALMLEAGRLLNVVVNEELTDKDSLKNFQRYYHEVVQENICWITDGSSKLKAIVEGYKWMLLRQKFIEEGIRLESRAESERYRMINKEIVRRKIKYGSVPSNNMRICSLKKSLVKSYKRDYLKQLKDERRKEREKAKKKKGI
ncbi:MAG: transglutaminase domain-containing protein [Bacteroidia bacterium]